MPPRCALRAFSGGPPYALAFAAARPEKTLATVIVSAAPPPEVLRVSKDVSPLYRVLVRACADRPWLGTAICRLPRGLFRLLPPRHLIGLARRMLPPPDRECLRRPSRRALVAESVGAAFSRPPRGLYHDGRLFARPWGFDVTGIRSPLTFHHGREDRNFRAGAIRPWAETIPGARFLEYPGEGHYSLPIRRLPSILRTLRKELPTGGNG